MKAVPVLGSDGWVTDPEKMMNHLYMNMYEANYSQSTAMYGEVTSFQHIITSYGNDPHLLSSQMTNAIRKYYSRYFDSADVSFTRVDTTDGENMVYNLEINATLGKKSVSLARTLRKGTGHNAGTFLETLGA